MTLTKIGATVTLGDFKNCDFNNSNFLSLVAVEISNLVVEKF